MQPKSVPIRPPIQTRYKLPLFNWTVLRHQQLKGTVFVGMDDEALLSRLEMNRFEEIFRLSSRAIDSGENNITTGGLTGGSTSTGGAAGIGGSSAYDGDATESVRRASARRPEKKSLIDTNRHRYVVIPGAYKISRFIPKPGFHLTISYMNCIHTIS
ncbi:unnamed protein product [Protopolystoma xenopodis]|uniref:Uncharacterized protein n=1 Tax=Protopolystoma xenopodis TaxID=117903 RepID=A0A3S5A733_9PLAT|nr:unnamed protein product [Protopolystoma xenopodis]